MLPEPESATKLLSTVQVLSAPSSPKTSAQAPSVAVLKVAKSWSLVSDAATGVTSQMVESTPRNTHIAPMMGPLAPSWVKIGSAVQVPSKTHLYSAWL